MRQAIETKYCGPTNYKGSRVIAKCAGGKVIMPWDHSKNVEANHYTAAMWLVRKLKWDELTGHSFEYWTGGCLPSGNYCFVYRETGNE